MSDHNEQYGWVRFSKRWPTKEDCDIYGNIEVAAPGIRSFGSIASYEDFRYNLNRAAWWRTPTPLPYIT